MGYSMNDDALLNGSEIGGHFGGDQVDAKEQLIMPQVPDNDFAFDLIAERQREIEEANKYKSPLKDPQFKMDALLGDRVNDFLLILKCYQ